MQAHNNHTSNGGRETNVKLGRAKESSVFEGIFDCVHELAAALKLLWTGDSSIYRVDTTSRLAQWRINGLSSFSSRKSDPFKMGNWNWRIAVEKKRMMIAIKLHPELTSLTRDDDSPPPIASFIIRVICSVAGDHRKTLIHPEVTDKQLKSKNDFVWGIEVPLHGKFIIDVEFIDLKIAPPQGGLPCSIWTGGPTQKQSSQTALVSLGKMLSENIHTDIVIHTSGGTITAHRAVLAARSPVFWGMFSHNLKEKELSTIDIPDMSIEVCRAFLDSIYGNITHIDFLVHRLDLLRAADKYDVADLKEACHKSLIEDINTKNVLQRLQFACLYRLPELKASCMSYLVKFGKVFDVGDEFDSFMHCGDRELVAEILQEILGAWKGF